MPAETISEELDEFLSSLIQQGLPDIRDQGRSFKFGELLHWVAMARREIGRTTQTPQMLWLGQDSNNDPP